MIDAEQLDNRTVITGDFKDVLTRIYTYEAAWRECFAEDRMGFLGSDIFNFTTYDGTMDKVFATRMCQVLTCIQGAPENNSSE